MRLNSGERGTLVKRKFKEKIDEIVKKREEMLKDERIDEVIERCTAEYKNISPETLLFIGRHGDPAGIPKDEVIREKVAWMIGLRLPQISDVDKKLIDEQVVYLSVISKDPHELEERFANY